ncbi:Adenylate/guanylate cyclase domain-containing protein, CHASE2 domain-containing [Desulfonema limicola]|uniref:Adenylate/guanylate cyclase domain-containing protein, CHASE2 domain-containing n=1 Tax=Desulfonema limicola TaxID=45656 RepID=A0A975B3Z5_9BACT|nr:adenylate/guanylate cyclase domain-containing protein [Desulfonema limicola]QTA78336.1 Adenylate/guanylate cyclase domain-containing protein, CHASE2 domain-containing [Desulfonema limicola]
MNCIKKYSLIFIIALSACIMIQAANRNKLLDPLENIYYDLWHQLAGQRYTPENVVIAAIDDKTLLAHPNEPLVFWSPHFARAVKVLRQAGARYIGIDFLFSVSAESWLNQIKWPLESMSRTFDIPMRQQLNSGDVVLIGIVVKTREGEEQVILPVFDYLFSLPGAHEDIGLANLYPDNDEIIRSFIPRFFDDSREPSLTFATLIAKRAVEKNPADFQKIFYPGSDFPDTSLPRAIGYVGPPGTFPRVCFENLLDPDALASPEIQNLKGKIVIIAQESSGTHDIHLTPFVRKFLYQGGQMMTGPEIHANIIETILTGRYPHKSSIWTEFIWLGIFIGTGTIIFFNQPPLKSMGYAVILNILCSGIAYLMFLKNQILPISGINIGLLFTYICSTGFRLTREEKTRSRFQKAVSPYVSDAIVTKILESDKLPDLGGEIFTVTVLFSDIRSFTTISEQLSPREVVEMLNTYYSLICEPILEHGGMIDKFIGDAVMAVFGAPAHQADHAGRSLKSAVKIAGIALEFQDWLKKRFPDKELPLFRIGIGLHSGQAVIGNIGSAKRMGYTAIGDTVNIASRLESMSKKLGWTIVAGRDTISAAGVEVKTGRTQIIQPTGRAGQIEVFEVLDINTE